MALIKKEKYIWDFWYFYDKKTKMFDVFFLNADKVFAKNNQHHYHSAVGVSKTIDWVDFFGFKPNYFSASKDSWDNTSIWSGDVIKMGDEKIIFYTSRDEHELDGTIQHIGIASVDETGKITRTGAKISAPGAFYMSYTDPKENTIQCWRDPFVFEIKDSVYMLVAAKRKDFPINERGCIALMELVDNKDITKWKHKKTVLSTSFSEVELPQIYITENGNMRIFFNAKKVGGSKHFMMTNAFSNIEEPITEEMDVCANIFEKNKYYGFRIVPEHNNIICAFNQHVGCVEIVYNIASAGIDKVFQIKPRL